MADLFEELREEAKEGSILSALTLSVRSDGTMAVAEKVQAGHEWCILSAMFCYAVDMAHAINTGLRGSGNGHKTLQ